MWNKIKRIKKRSRNFILIIASITLYSLISLLYDGKFISLDNDQVLYLYSTAAQVLAALIGLIFTGYIFYRNILHTAIQNDLGSQKIIKKYEKHIYYDTIDVSKYSFIAIGFSLLCIAFNDRCGEGFNILLNFAGSSIIIALIYILNYMISILNPGNQKKYCKTVFDELVAGGDISKDIGEYNDFTLKLLKSLESIDDKYDLRIKINENPMALIKQLVFLNKLDEMYIEKFQNLFYEGSLIEIVEPEKITPKILNNIQELVKKLNIV